jgi:hypothetical protein
MNILIKCIPREIPPRLLASGITRLVREGANDLGALVEFHRMFEASCDVANL